MKLLGNLSNYCFRALLVSLICAACAHKVPPSPPVTAPVYDAPAPSPPLATFNLLRPAPDRVAQLAKIIHQITSSSDFEDAIWGIKIVSLDRNEVLYEENSRKLLLPASNMKIITAASALLRLGPDFRYRTLIQTDGEIVKGRLNGNLIVIGSGDPTISSRMQGNALRVFEEWARTLRSEGIRSIDGSIIGVDANFDGQRYGEGWPPHAFNAPYAAEVSALQFNDNVIEVRVTPGRSRRSANVRLYPPTRYVSLYNRVITRAGHSNRFIAYRQEDRNTIYLRGTIGTRDRSDVRYVTVHEPAGYFITVLKETLAKKGIRVRGSRLASVEESESILASPEQYRVLLEHVSFPLRDIVLEMMKSSHNLFAESLAKTIGLIDMGEGSIHAAQNAIRQILQTLNIFPEELIMDDGSGLSTNNFVTANLLAQVLTAMHKTPVFQSFYDSFPVAGVDGTLKNRMIGTPAEANVHAKTGYVGGVRSLSGYVRTRDGELLVFAMLLNNFGIAIRDVDAVQEELCIRLAEFTRR